MSSPTALFPATETLDVVPRNMLVEQQAQLEPVQWFCSGLETDGGNLRSAWTGSDTAAAKDAIQQWPGPHGRPRASGYASAFPGPCGSGPGASSGEPFATGANRRSSTAVTAPSMAPPP